MYAYLKFIPLFHIYHKSYLCKLYHSWYIWWYICCTNISNSLDVKQTCLKKMCYLSVIKIVAYTDGWWYNILSKKILHWLRHNINQFLPVTKDIPYLILTGDLWSVYCWFIYVFRKKIILYHTVYCRAVLHSLILVLRVVWLALTVIQTLCKTQCPKSN